MLQRLSLMLATCLLPLSCEAKIVETAHIREVMQYIDADTWFLVDLDNTLFEAKQALGHGHWFHDEVQKRLAEGMSREEAIRDVYPYWVETQQVCPVQPLETDFIPSLIALQNRGVTVMGLTHRQPSVAQATIRQVASLDFDFTKTAPFQSCLVVPSSTPTLYSQGILFVGDYNKKSDVFLPFLSMINKTPKKIVFIDDKRKNVEEVEQALSGYEINYVGVYYTAIEHAKPVYSRELAEYQYKYLNTILSNEAASILMQSERLPD